MDGDAFFVGCEVAKNPKLKGLPVVTGEERGIVSALSYEAKALGIKRGMPIFKLKKEFPNVLVLPGDYKSYAKFSEDMFNIVRRYADEVEEYSIDECFADLTGLDKPLYVSYEEIAKRIKKEIESELGLSVSIGVAPTKVLAKVASKWQKPNGLTIINRENILDFLEKTSIGSVWGIGPRTSLFLSIKDVKTAKDFVLKSYDWVKENLSLPYEVIWQELSGNSVSKINSDKKTDYSSMQRTRSFHPFTSNEDFLLSQLSKNIEEATFKSRYYSLVPKSLYFFIKTKDFRYKSYFTSLPAPTNSPEILFGLIRDNFHRIYQKGVLYRSTGVTLSELVPNPKSQRSLFGETDSAQKFEKIHESIDSLEEKVGKKLVYLGSTFKAKKFKQKGTEAESPDRNLLFL